MTINLKSYTDSEGFVGFFVLKDSFSQSGLDKMTSILEDLDRVFVFDSFLTSLVPVGDKDNLIESYDYQNHELDELNILVDQEFVGINKVTLVSNPDVSKFLELAKIILKFVCIKGGLVGHFFWVSEDIYIYPHDEFGLGFILRNKGADEKLANVMQRYSSFLSFFK